MRWRIFLRLFNCKSLLSAVSLSEGKRRNQPEKTCSMQAKSFKWMTSMPLKWLMTNQWSTPPRTWQAQHSKTSSIQSKLTTTPGDACWWPRATHTRGSWSSRRARKRSASRGTQRQVCRSHSLTSLTSATSLRYHRSSKERGKKFYFQSKSSLGIRATESSTSRAILTGRSASSGCWRSKGSRPNWISTRYWRCSAKDKLRVFFWRCTRPSTRSSPSKYLSKARTTLVLT